MLSGLYRKPSAYIGLAVHDERLSMVKLKQFKKQLVIEDVATQGIPAGTVADGKVQVPLQLEKAFKELAMNRQIDHCFVALALPASQVINKRIKVAAYLTDEEQAVEITTNLKSYLPGMDERLYLDFMPIEKRDQDMELQLIAARAEQVDTYLHLIQTAGLKVNIVDVDVYAIARGIQWMARGLLPETMVVLDMDMTSAQLILLKDRSVISVYPIVVDNDNILLQQIKRGMQIFLAAEKVAIEKIIITGYLINLDRFENLLQSELNISIETLDSLHDGSMSGVSEWLVALGLALRGFPRA